jgi:hypothetical protein
MILLSILAAIGFALGIKRRNYKIVFTVPIIMIITGALGTGAGMMVQNLIVSPDEINKERQYLQNNITFTQHAYDLHDVQTKLLPATFDLTSDDIKNNMGTINNIRINDFGPAQTFYNQTQSIRLYYTFNDVDVDRYMVNGEYTQTFLSAREIDETKTRQEWLNKHLKYTHGYGITLSRVDQVTASGQPDMLIDSIPPISQIEEIEITRPEIYFGELTNTYILTNTNELEFDYVAYYKQLIQNEGAEAEVIFSSNPRTILEYTKNVLVCDIHTRARTKKILKAAGAEIVFGLDDILNASVDGSGYNTKYGILGSNLSTETTVKLFPNDCTKFVTNIQEMIKKETGKLIEVMVYGDGAFKDPVGRIWELADPVVSPGYTPGLEGTPNEVKLKYLADNEFAHLSGEELKAAINEYIKAKDNNLDDMAALGTTPRRLTDLIGSLCDLTSGSGDKGTPIVYIKGYFDNYTKC